MSRKSRKPTLILMRGITDNVYGHEKKKVTNL